MRIRAYRDHDFAAVRALWRVTGLTMSYNDPAIDIAFCRGSGHGELFVGETDDGRLAATVMAGHDGHRGWIYYLAVDSAQRRCGHGKRLLRHAENWLAEHGVPKVLLMVRENNGEVSRFYEGLGYERAPSLVFGRWLRPPSS